jgi:CheY-like chemotaxis protein
VHSSGAGGLVPLLYVDDSESDRLLIRETIPLTKTPFRFYEAYGAKSAKPYFQFQNGDGEPNQFPRPALVLLDYDLGDHNGADFLYWLRITKRLTSIPVVMFSGSHERECIDKCYAAGANYFISKPYNLERFKVIVRTLYRSLMPGDDHPSPILHLLEYQPNSTKRTPIDATPQHLDPALSLLTRRLPGPEL